ncbi:MAG TPA: SDR family NAD(P)-dependent oxidoreductase, partial [Kofleriaceae bacterium]|nr:SDR family NAD(P)-dependent oxidoreductase [Kofleriaceae bacterium]
AGGLRPTVIAGDLSVRGEPLRIARAAEAALGTIDVLVNNAGVQMFAAIGAGGDGDEGRAVMETNFFAPLALTAAVLPAMRARRAGCIVQVTSLASTMPTPFAGHYAASKGALANATEALRAELRGTGVHVVHVVPGPVETPMFAEGRAIARDVIDGTPRGKPDRLARLVARAIERRRRLVVYPRWTWIGRLWPSLALALARRALRDVTLDPTSILAAGSRGSDATVRERRAASASASC